MEPACRDKFKRVFQEEPDAAAEVIRVLGKAKVQAVYVRMKAFTEENFKVALRDDYYTSQGMLISSCKPDKL